MSYGTIHGGPAQGFELDLGEPSEWVTVDVGRAAVLVRCARCNAHDGIYWSVVGRDRSIVRRKVEGHAACREAA